MAREKIVINTVVLENPGADDGDRFFRIAGLECVNSGRKIKFGVRQAKIANESSNFLVGGSAKSLFEPRRAEKKRASCQTKNRED